MASVSPAASRGDQRALATLELGAQKAVIESGIWWMTSGGVVPMKARTRRPPHESVVAFQDSRSDQAVNGELPPGYPGPDSN